jgi:hypothetical protein
MLFKFLFLLNAASAFLFSDFTSNKYIVKQQPYDTVTYVPSSIGSPRIEGMRAVSPPKSQATLEYDINFDPQFEWVKGGKLPGVRGGDRKITTTGCVVPQPKDAWSFRLMWRQNARISMYMYDQERTVRNERCGLSRESKDWLLTKGVWHRLKLHVKVNSNATAKDGIAQLFVNNSLILERKGIQWYSKGYVPVSYVYFSSFYGGNDKTWAPSKKTFIKFRNVSFW